MGWAPLGSMDLGAEPRRPRSYRQMLSFACFMSSCYEGDYDPSPDRGLSRADAERHGAGGGGPDAHLAAGGEPPADGPRARDRACAVRPRAPPAAPAPGGASPVPRG